MKFETIIGTVMILAGISMLVGLVLFANLGDMRLMPTWETMFILIGAVNIVCGCLLVENDR